MTTLDDLARVEREYRERHGKDNVTANSVFALKLADTIAAYVKAQKQRDRAFVEQLAALLSMQVQRLNALFDEAYERCEKDVAPPNQKAEGFKEPTP